MHNGALYIIAETRPLGTLYLILPDSNYFRLTNFIDSGITIEAPWQPACTTSLSYLATEKVLEHYVHGRYPEDYLDVIAQCILGDFYKKPVPQKRERENDDEEVPDRKKARTEI
jgi:hypothetical protein